MKTLTVKQPWAYLICSGIKDIENRTWPTKLRGRVLIHAGKAKYSLEKKLFTKEQFLKLSFDNVNPFRQKYGAIIGSVDIVDCVQNHRSIWAEKDCYNWVLKNPVLFDKPIENVKGKLSFWEFTGTIPTEKASQ